MSSLFHGYSSQNEDNDADHHADQNQDVDQLTTIAFNELKPICIQILGSFSSGSQLSTSGTITRLVTVLHGIQQPHLVLPRLFSYVSFPLLQLLQAPNLPQKTREGALECLLFLLLNLRCDDRNDGELNSISQVDTNAITVDLLHFIPFIIAHGYICLKRPASGADVTTVVVPEETKLLAVKCLLALMDDQSRSTSTMTSGRNQAPSSPSQLTTLLTNTRLQPALGHVVYVLLNLLITEKLLDLKIHCLKCLQVIFTHLSESSDLLSPMLPGVVSNLVKMLNNKGKGEHHTVLQLSLDVLRVILYGVFRDDKNGELLDKNQVVSFQELSQRLASKMNRQQASQQQQSPSSRSIDSTIGQEDRTKPPTIIRDKQWLKVTLPRLTPVFSHLTTLTTHQIPSVRLSLVHLFRSLLQCTVLGPSLGEILDATISMSVIDEEDAVQEIATSTLESLRVTKTLETVSKERVFTLLHRLPTVLINEPFDEPKARAVGTVRGYLSILKSDLDVLLSVSNVWGGIIRALELESSRVADVTVTHTLSGYGFPKRWFKAFRDDGVVELLQGLFFDIGHYGNLSQSIDSLMVFVDEELGEESRMQSALCVLAQIVRGVAVKSNSNTTLSRDQNDELLLSLLNRLLTLTPTNALTISLLLECITNISLSLSRTKVQLSLLRSLYHVLQYASSSNTLVSSSSHAFLHHVSKYLEEPTVKSFVLHNVDYLMHKISIQLRHLHSHSVAQVIKSSIEICGGETVVQHLSDVVVELVDRIGEVDDERVGVLVDVLGVIVKAIVGQDLVEDKKDATMEMMEDVEDGISSEVQEFMKSYKLKLRERRDKTMNNESKSIDEIKEFFEEHSKQPTEPDTQSDQEMEEPPSITSPEDPPVPLSISLTHRILTTLSNYLSHSSPHIRHGVLQTLCNALPLLSQHSKTFLPLVHRIWVTLTARLSDTEQFVVLETLKVVEGLCVYANDFMTKRVVEDVVPKLNKVMKRCLDAEYSAVKESKVGKKSWGQEMDIVVPNFASVEMVDINPSAHTNTNVNTNVNNDKNKDKNTLLATQTTPSKRSSMYHHSYLYKLQHQCLTTLHRIVESVPLRLQDSFMVVDMVFPYLNNAFVDSLQFVAKEIICVFVQRRTIHTGRSARTKDREMFHDAREYIWLLCDLCVYHSNTDPSQQNGMMECIIRPLSYGQIADKIGEQLERVPKCVINDLEKWGSLIGFSANARWILGYMNEQD